MKTFANVFSSKRLAIIIMLACVWCLTLLSLGLHF